jgi:hypothetical protein
MKARHLAQKFQTSDVSEISWLLLRITIPDLYRATEFPERSGRYQEFHTHGVRVFCKIMFHKLPELSFVNDCNGPEFTIDFSSAEIIWLRVAVEVHYRRWQMKRYFQLPIFVIFYNKI